MKEKIFYILIILMLSTPALHAYDWSSAGLQEAGTGTSGEENYIMLKGAGTAEIKVRYFGELEDSWAAKVVELNAKFSQWKYMKPGNIEYLVTGDSIEILVVPSSFNYKGVDFLPYIPGGMTFINDYAFRYNFRITKDNLFLRLNDRFVDEELLCRRMKEALDDPISYLKKREPEYFLQKLNELEESLALLKNNQEKLRNSVLYFENSGFLGFGNTPIKSTLIKKVVEYKTVDPAISMEKVKDKLEKEKIEAKDKEIELIFNVFYNEYK